MDAEEQDAHTHRSVSPVLRRLLLCILCTSKCQPLFPRDLTGDVRAVDLPLVLGMANLADRLVALMAASSLPNLRDGRSGGDSTCALPSSGRLGGGGAQGGALRCSTSSRLLSSR